MMRKTRLKMEDLTAMRDEEAEALAAAIVEQACRDYVIGRSRTLFSKNAAVIRGGKRLLKSSLAFFAGEWFSTLSCINPASLISMLDVVAIEEREMRLSYDSRVNSYNKVEV